MIPPKQIKNKVTRLNKKLQNIQNQILELQEMCDHSGDLIYEYHGSSGNYDPSNNGYWIEWRCHDCGKFWTTTQDNSWHLTHSVYPNAKRLKK